MNNWLVIAVLIFLAYWLMALALALLANLRRVQLGLKLSKIRAVAVRGAGMVVVSLLRLYRYWLMTRVVSTFIKSQNTLPEQDADFCTAREEKAA